MSQDPNISSQQPHYPPRDFQQPQQQSSYPPQQPPYMQQQPYMQPQQQMPYPPQQPPYMQQQPYMQPQQQAYYPMQPPVQQPIAMQSVNITIGGQKKHGLLTRIVYFCFIGWWLGLFWMNLGFALCALVVTLPVGLMMLNRLPQIMTLHTADTSTTIQMQNVQTGQGLSMQSININIGTNQQYNFFLRALYFCCIGCWAGYLWAWLGYFCCCTIILLPVGVMMFNRLPLVLTLRKN